MRIGVIADVHGNLLALQAVLARLEKAAPDLIVNLGDLVSGAFDPAGAADLQMRLGIPTISGNHERQLLEGAEGRSDAFARPLLSQAHLHWMANLPKTVTLADGDVFACHGSPAGGDLEYLMEDISTGRPVMDTAGNIAARLAGIGDSRVVLCGHTHVSRVAWIGGVLIVNPGSVGMPAYRGSFPVPHLVEAGAPHARYAVIEKTPAGWSAELHAVAYDFEAAARQAEQAGRDDVAHAMRTGRLPAP
ncbi:metallophosphatase family protein [Rhizobium sp. NTR19]|uniref:Metallophosphatase family protein n=1 Tax=Neorhizobium turbinariae TaxID=2937795 RepID=A0ABT0IM19_9HYPH|nr:metallophosphoesterase family protein [Neorhizobium turbinariae]MCK8778896.1 metallophosphatase family protein [Neorhizobium turbinariae]